MAKCDDASNENELVTIKEGKAQIISFSKGVFYNPVQEFNRDLSVAVISLFSAEHCKLKQEKSDNLKHDLPRRGVERNKFDESSHSLSRHGITMAKLEELLRGTHFFHRTETSNYNYSWNIEMLSNFEIEPHDPSTKEKMTKAFKFFEIVVKPVRRKHIKDAAPVSNTVKNSDRKKQRHLKVYLMLVDVDILKNSFGYIDNVINDTNASSNKNKLEKDLEKSSHSIIEAKLENAKIVQSSTEYPENSSLEMGETSDLNWCISITSNDKKVIARKRFCIVPQGFDEEKNIENSQSTSDKVGEALKNEQSLAVEPYFQKIEFVLEKPQSLVFEIDKHLNNKDCEDTDIIIQVTNSRSLVENTVNSFKEDEQESDIKPQTNSAKSKEISDHNLEENFVFADRKPPGEKYEDGIKILEALSASGLRSIRYAKEVPGVEQIFANDISHAAVESIKKNVACNNVEHLVTTSNVNAISHVYEEKFDVVDLDPYGSASQFLNAAIENLVDGGLMLVTCTDMAVLAGNVPEACYAKYGAMPLRNSACHEMAIRIVLNCIQEHAADYNKYIVPLLSISADFYIRVFVKIYSFDKIDKIAKNGTSLVHQCTGCHTLRLSEQTILNHSDHGRTPVTEILNRFCDHCGKRTVLGGPIWFEPIHDLEFVGKVLSVIKSQPFNTMKRMEGMLKLIFEELNDVPLYYTVESLCSKVHCEVLPQIVFHSAVLNAGYDVTLSHCAPNSLKTNAPASVIWDILRCWVETHPVSKKRLVEGSVALALLQKKPSLKADFTVNSKAISELKMNKVLRYQQNPQPFWGPGCRDRTNYPSEEMKNKRQMNQNKRNKNKKKRKVDDTSSSLIIKSTPSDNEDSCSE
ncbi:probable tRNA (guanine(26)-N(2))-dimethyltransferase [Nilaparvata lugens]|uniref:probable tRNA (guanine(26)-N(2))-dimethyltransferase n=1 Tax=Nilaparvata lugens TaxID=108931 RepID=UPI00193CDA9B|nr:probable tRNA (guanine(26)-N(2))-dimethyltransferase [Nilaparvata lugens]